MKRAYTAAALLLLFATTRYASAMSPRLIPPLESLSDVAVETVIGSTLAIEGNKATALFGNDFGRIRAFRSDLTAAIAQHLAKRGLPIRADSPNTIGVDLYGGTFENVGCQSKVFFNLIMWVYDDKAKGNTIEQGLLGVVDDVTLERDLTRVILSVIDSFLGERPLINEKH